MSNTTNTSNTSLVTAISNTGGDAGTGRTISSALTSLLKVEQMLQGEYVARDEVIRVLSVALVTGKPVVLLGQPGTAKSSLIERLASCITGGNTGRKSFVRQLTKFTHPSELLGAVSIAALKRGEGLEEYKYNTKNMLPDSLVVYLDEIFKGSSAILQYLLRILNGDDFENGFDSYALPALVIIGASNELPEDRDGDLAALWDRMVMRYWVEPIQPGTSDYLKYLRLLNSPNAHSKRPPTAYVDAEDILLLREASYRVTIDDTLLQQVGVLVEKLEVEGISISNRKVRHLLHILQANALLNARSEVNEEDFDVLVGVLWSEREHIKVVVQILASMQSPLLADAKQLYDDFLTIVEAANKDAAAAAAKAKANNQQEGPAKIAVYFAAATKMKQGTEALDALYSSAQRGSPTAEKIDKMRDSYRNMYREFAKVKLNF